MHDATTILIGLLLGIVLTILILAARRWWRAAPRPARGPCWRCGARRASWGGTRHHARRCTACGAVVSSAAGSGSRRAHVPVEPPPKPPGEYRSTHRK